MSIPSPLAPRAEYERRRADWQRRAELLGRRDRLLSRYRLLCFLATVALGLAALRWDEFAAGWMILPGALFLALAVWHEQVARGRARAEVAVAFYRRGLLRLDDAWAGTGITRTDLAGDDHPYAADLDLFGPGSLFELLCGARTEAGQRTLAAWLLQPAPLEVVRARQRAVEELRPRLDLREELALLGAQVEQQVAAGGLLAWSRQPPPFTPRAARLATAAAWALPLGVALLGALWSVFPAGRYALIGLFVLEWVALHRAKDRLDRVVAVLDQAGRELGLLGQVVERLDREPATSPRLLELKQALQTGGLSARASLRRLERLTGWHAAYQNQLFAPVAFLLLWRIHFGLAIERWRVRHGAAIERWLQTIGELEALCDLAGYAYEHPTDPFPTLVEGPALFSGADLGHPLLPAIACVRNSVALGADCRVWVVSGSNMSGKTTLLRTVGTNAVLAQAGAPVRAARLELSALRVGGTLRIHDSIQQGTSRFYSEIRRIRELQEIARNQGPLLFLLDEILHGTNSHDRRIGAEAVVRGLVGAGAIGLVTTHDLALAEVTGALGAPAINVHFADELVDGKLHFDYQVRSGVVQRSNALALMRSIGLDV